MAFIGSLVTTVKANTEPFKKKMKGAASIAEKFGKAIKKVGIGIAKFGVALGVVAVGALVLYTLRAFKAIDATAKLASELDITTEALTGYQLAAGLSGVSTETLNKAIQRMVRTVGEARIGVTTGTKALEDFGLKLEDIEGLNTQETFELIADRIAAIEDPMIRSAKAALIFGKSGQKLINFFKTGSEGMARLRDELDELGISFSAVDAAKVEAANDAILRMQTVATGLGNTLAIAVSPFVEDLTTKFTDWIKESGGIDTIVNKALKETAIIAAKIADLFELGTAAVRFFSGGVRIAVVAMINPFVGLERIIRGILNLFNDDISTTGFIKQVSEDLKELATDDFIAATEALEKFKRKTETPIFKSLFDDIGKSAESVAKSVEKITAAQKILNEETREYKEELKAISKIQKQQIEDHKKVIEEATRIFEATRTPLEKVEAEIQRIIELMNEGLEGRLSEGLDRKMKELKKLREELLKEQDKTITKTAGESLREVDGVQEGIEDQIEKTKIPLEEMIARLESFAAGVGEAVDPTAKVGGFKELDLKNVDISGIDRALNLDKQQLNESMKQTNILQEILESNRGANFGAVTV